MNDDQFIASLGVTPEEEKRQAILQALTTAQGSGEVDAARADAKRQALIANIGSALSTAANAQSVSRGGRPSDQSYFNNLAAQGQGDVQSAQADRQAKIASVLQQLQLQKDTSEENRAERQSALQKQQFDEELKQHAAQSTRDTARLEFDKEKEKTDQANVGVTQKQGQDALDLRQQEITASAAAKDADRDARGTTALDKQYAEHYNSFTQGGLVAAQKSLEVLEHTLAEVEAEEKKGIMQAGGGSFFAALPDALRAEKSIRMRDTAVTSANATLKGLFGAQLSNDERKSASNEFYNDKLGNAENAQILKTKIAEMKDAMAQQIAKANYYAKNGQSLAGYDPNLRMPAQHDKEPLSPAEQQRHQYLIQKVKQKYGR